VAGLLTAENAGGLKLKKAAKRISGASNMATFFI
jgi:hypothetical protein